MNRTLFLRVILVALAAGPWPELPRASLVARVLLAMFLCWWPRRFRALSWILLAVVVASFCLELALTRPFHDHKLEQAFRQQITKLQKALTALAQRSALTQLLMGTGAEAQPEVPFALLGQTLRRLPAGVGSLVLVDSQAEPVAWAGAQPRFPILWRPLGERGCFPEPWVGEVMLWCREPVYASGRILGGILAAVPLPEKGLREVLGVSGGPRSLVVPSLVWSEHGPAQLRLRVRPARPLWWAASGEALVFTPLLLLLWAPASLKPWLALTGAFSAVMVGWFGWAYLPAVVLLALAFSLRGWPATRLSRLTFALAASFIVWALPPLVAELGSPPLPQSLLLPPASFLANLLGLVAFLLVLPAAPKPRPWLALPLFLVGLLSASAVLLALALGVLVFLLGNRQRILWVAGAAAAVFAGSGDGLARNLVLAKTEATLARWGEVKSVARALLGSLPEGRLEELVHAPPGIQGVRLGDLSLFLELDQVLPGTVLLLEENGERVTATWGEVGLLVQGREQELASRNLPLGYRLRLLAPPSPHHVLAALAASGVGAPVAAFDRAGAPVSRGAPFRPLSPTVVGEALARGRGWTRVVVGSRSVPTYLRAFDDWVLAVPWIRPAWPDFGLLLGALFLWGGVPFLLQQMWRRLQAWWQTRGTFTGRLRAVAFASALVPLGLLGQVLPSQWVREREESRLQMARALASALAQSSWQEGLEKLVRDLGAVVTVYRRGFLAVTSRPDLAARGGLPMLPPREAYVRAVRRWWEPLIEVDNNLALFIPVKAGDRSLVFGILDIAEVTGSRYRPADWFVFTALWAVILAFAAVEGLAQRLARPMERLVSLAHRLGKGEPPDLSTLDSSGDEFATLAQAFFRMAQKIEERQTELRGQRDLLYRILENLSAAVMVVENNRVILANGAAKKIMGGEDLSTLLGIFGTTFDELLTRAETGECVSEKRIPFGQGDALWQLTAVLLTGETSRVLLVLEDLSDVARAERLASLNELARIVAHEVKNPLTPIHLWVEELAAALEKGPESVAEVARLVVPEVLQQVRRLREVAQDFSNLVALEHWEPTGFDVVAMAQEVVEDYKVLERRGVAVQLITGQPSLVVFADRTWVQRALRHLLENSTQALGTRKGKITVKVALEQGWALLSVRDTAGGVAAEQLPRLFEPHFSTTAGGSGLGLAVVSRVCQKAGGRAEAHNLRQGLEVRMFLPLAS